MARQKIELAPQEAEELSRRARATTVSVRDRQRAEIIVLSAQGQTQQRIAEQLGISRIAVNRCSRWWSGDAAAPSGAMELPHDGPRRRDLAGQRAAPVGGQ